NSATPVTQAAEVVPEVATEANPAPSAAPQPPQSEKSEAPEPDVQAPAAPAAPVSAPQEPQADGYVDELMGSPVLLGVLGGSALLLLLVGLMVLSRRNAMREAELQESLLADNSTDSFYVAQHELDSSDTESADLGASHDAGQVSADSLAGTGSDPLAEADIYIAYGRFNQAAELLQNALNDEPQRSDLRLKLMEVYAELGDREGFARQEAELREIGGSSAEIEQTKARYPAMAAAGFGAVAASVSASDDLDSFSLDDLELEEPAPLAEQQADDDFDLSLDDLELEDDLTDLSVTPVGGSAVERDDVNFDE
ncbi:MAG TPA: peptigoglycan-binding protein LysM, partial [Pseudomonas sp.]|nr:peptigoglycan-binding protein LysM [Pseudomonas sp.]